MGLSNATHATVWLFFVCQIFGGFARAGRGLLRARQRTVGTGGHRGGIRTAVSLAKMAVMLGRVCKGARLRAAQIATAGGRNHDSWPLPSLAAAALAGSKVDTTKALPFGWRGCCVTVRRSAPPVVTTGTRAAAPSATSSGSQATMARNFV